MDLKFFCVNENRHLETSSAKAFFVLYAEGTSLFWVDITQPDPAALAEFLSPLRLHPLILEGCQDPAAGACIAPYERALYIKLPVLTGLDNLNHLFLSVICLPRAIITVHESSISAFERTATEFSTSVRFHALNTSAILYQILDRLIDEDLVFASQARRDIDSLAEAMDQEEDSVQIDQILEFKRRLARLVATFEDQGTCFTSLQTVESEVFDVKDFREYFRDSLSHIDYALRSAARQQTHLAELHQHYLLMLQDKTNKRLRILTILSAVFMPLTLIAAIYGMNFRYMPELGWLYGYPLAIGGMLVLAAVLLWIFYWRGWFK